MPQANGTDNYGKTKKIIIHNNDANIIFVKEQS
jgi:hypothetical protein